MKKLITTTLAAAALLVTNVQANFNLDALLEEMKEAATSMMKDTPAVQKEGAVETAKSSEEATAKTEEHTKES